MTRGLPFLFSVLFTVLPSAAYAATLPQLEWRGEGKVDWSAGYIISYGSAAPPSNPEERGLLHGTNRKAAYREAYRNLLRLSLDVTVQDSFKVRDFFRGDPELLDEFKKKLWEIPPWEIRLGRGGEVALTLRLPLSGSGGLTELLDRMERGVDGAGESRTPPNFRGDPGADDVSGLVLMVSGRTVAPALKPRIRGRGGNVLLGYSTAGERARSRPVFVAYYDTLEDALLDPLVGAHPVVAAADPYPGSGTDLLLPAPLEEDLLAMEEGGSLLTDARVVVVLQQ
jgi:hypothetical protein